jgi:hypothetical protein
MILIQGDISVKVNTLSNWPLIEDLFNKWGHEVTKDVTLKVPNLDKITSELSAWGIPWKWHV